MAKEDQGFPNPQFRYRKRSALFLILGLIIGTVLSNCNLPAPTPIGQPTANQLPTLTSTSTPAPIILTSTLTPNPTLSFTPTITPSLTPSPPPQLPTNTPPQVGTPCDSIYVIQPGETLFSIARRCGVTLSQLYAANPSVGPYVYPGQVLHIPSTIPTSVPTTVPTSNSTALPTIPSSPTPIPTQTLPVQPSGTPNPTQTFQAAKEEVKEEYKNAKIAYSSPQRMNKGDTTRVELLLNRVLSETALATMEVTRTGFPTSTAEPGVLTGPSGEELTIGTANIKITDRMKVVLYSDDPKAFEVQAMSQEEQVIGLESTAIWRWSITALEEGPQTLELVVSWLIQDEGKDYWTEVETYKDTIIVDVTTIDRIKSWDWKWVIGTLLTVVGTFIAILKWIDSRMKKAPDNNQSYTPE